MITLRIVISKMHEKVKDIAKDVKEDASEINRAVYETLTRHGIDEEAAIDCASWCELAAIGDSYCGEDEEFEVYINEYRENSILHR